MRGNRRGQGGLDKVVTVAESNTLRRENGDWCEEMEEEREECWESSEVKLRREAKWREGKPWRDSRWHTRLCPWETAQRAVCEKASYNIAYCICFRVLACWSSLRPQLWPQIHTFTHKWRREAFSFYLPHRSCEETPDWLLWQTDGHGSLLPFFRANLHLRMLH